MYRKELYGVFLVLFLSHSIEVIHGLCVVNVTIEGGPVLRVNENHGLLSVNLKRTGNTTIVVQLNVTTEAGTASAGSDFVQILPYQTVTFNANNDSSVVNVTIVNNNIMEELIETFYMNLTSNDANVCTPLPRATIEIKDDDKVTVGFHDSLRNFNEIHGNFTLIFFKSKNQTEIPITLRYFTAGIGNAVINTDYTNISHSFTFQPSQFNKEFVFPNTPTIINNNIVEATKCFNISLESTNPNVVYTIQQSKICILNDDKVTIEFVSTNITVDEEKGTVSMEIMKTGQATIPIKVRLSMVERYFETAVKNVDYTDRNNDIITIEKNESKKSVEIKIKNDDEAESIEVFAVGLEAIDSSTTLIGSKNMAVVRITDQVDRDYQTKTQKQIEADQEKRAKMISILLFVSIGIIIIISAVLIIALCLIHRWTKKNTK